MKLAETFSQELSISFSLLVRLRIRTSPASCILSKTQRCFAVLFVYLSRYLGQEIAKWPFRSSSQAATCYYQSNH